MESSEIQRMISEGIPDAEVHVDGDGSHFIAKVICEKFDGLPLIKQHKMVYATLGETMGADIHALSIQTYTRKSWEKAQLFKVN
jgi:acid stress-induced BolA-like protein IbaG/YrbA